MRTREEIENSLPKSIVHLRTSGSDEYPLNIPVEIELLLDIRDLLANPPIEITGEDITSDKK